DIYWGFLIFLAVAAPWYAWTALRYRSQFIGEFFYNDHWRRLITAEHPQNDHWYFYPVSIVGGMMPWGLYAAAALVFGFKGIWRENNPSRTYLLCWIVVVFFVFQIAHSKLASYILPVFPAVALLTGDFIVDHITISSPKIIKTLAFFTAFILI